jgi:curved DNA-binding protein CbpA
MPSAYEILGVAPDADDETIRRRYLELANQFQPEFHPDRFAAIRSAYEKVKDVPARARYFLFDLGSDCTIDTLIEEAACRTPRPRIGLTRLLKITGTLNR